MTKILVVDDDVAGRNGLAELLDSCGYAVCEAGDGCEALALLEGGYRPSVILLDLNMPVMNGWQFLAALDRNGTVWPPILVISAACDHRPLPQSVVAVFPKPFDFELLSRTIESIAA